MTHGTALIEFDLPLLLPLWNAWVRMSHWQTSRYRKMLAWEVTAAMGRQKPLQPFLLARVTIGRHTIKRPDRDNLCAKSLLDVLQPVSKTHPSGLGVITNDDEEHIRTEMFSLKVASTRLQKTVVSIKCVGSFATTSCLDRNPDR